MPRNQETSPHRETGQVRETGQGSSQNRGKRPWSPERDATYNFGSCEQERLKAMATMSVEGNYRELKNSVAYRHSETSDWVYQPSSGKYAIPNPDTWVASLSPEEARENRLKECIDIVLRQPSGSKVSTHDYAAIVSQIPDNELEQYKNYIKKLPVAGDKNTKSQTVNNRKTIFSEHINRKILENKRN